MPPPSPPEQGGLEDPLRHALRPAAVDQPAGAGGDLGADAHVEERPDHPVDGLTGFEIYNRHWDAKRDLASLITLAFKLTDPKQLAELLDKKA